MWTELTFNSTKNFLVISFHFKYSRLLRRRTKHHTAAHSSCVPGLTKTKILSEICQEWTLVSLEKEPKSCSALSEKLWEQYVIDDDFFVGTIFLFCFSRETIDGQLESTNYFKGARKKFVLLLRGLKKYIRRRTSQFLSAIVSHVLNVCYKALHKSTQFFSGSKTSCIINPQKYSCLLLSSKTSISKFQFYPESDGHRFV